MASLVFQVANDQMREGQRVEIRNVVTEETGEVIAPQGEHEQPQVATLFYNLGEQLQGQGVGVGDQRPIILREGQVAGPSGNADINYIYQFQAPTEVPQQASAKAPPEVEIPPVEPGEDQPGKGRDKRRKKKDKEEEKQKWEEKSKRLQKQLLQQRAEIRQKDHGWGCLLYTSPSPRDGLLSRMPSSA